MRFIETVERKVRNLGRDVAQCGNDFMGEKVFGNVNERSVMDIWNATAFRTFRGEVRLGKFKSEVCQRCIFDAPTPISSTPVLLVRNYARAEKNS